MYHKLQDIPYFGVDRRNINQLDISSVDHEMLDLFLYYISERYTIHIKKDVNYEEPPWTKDPILRYYKFTNVCREHDRNTMWLINAVVGNNDLSYTSKLANATLFRIFNKIETAKLLQIPISNIRSLDPIKLAEKVEPQLTDTPWTGAYLCSATKRYFRQYTGTDSDIESVLMVVQELFEDPYWKRTAYTPYADPAEVIDKLQKYPGISDFLAYQLFVDFTYIKEFPFSENEFTIAGVGAVSGLKLLFGGTKRKTGCTPEELIFWLRDNWNRLNKYNLDCGGKHTVKPKSLMQDLPENDRIMNVMRIENCLCEFSKYYKAKFDLGRPRKRYTGG